MFIGTLNNPSAHYKDFDLKDYLEKWHTSGAVYVTGQLEKGKDETPHVQFYLQYTKDKKKSFSALKKLCKHSHFELIK